MGISWSSDCPNLCGCFGFHQGVFEEGASCSWHPLLTARPYTERGHVVSNARLSLLRLARATRAHVSSAVWIEAVNHLHLHTQKNKLGAMHAAAFLSRGRAAAVGAARVIQGACGTTARTATRSLPTTCWDVNTPTAPACRWRSSSACGAAVGVAARGGSSSVDSPLSTTGAHHSRHQPPQRGMKSGRKPWLEDRANRPAFSRAELDHVLGVNISSSVSWLLSASQLHVWGCTVGEALGDWHACVFLASASTCSCAHSHLGDRSQYFVSAVCLTAFLHFIV